jgi:antitoxin component YwqK of YwqJK toxin-antitoxin module
MKINILPKSEKECEQLISKWSNGNVHFILNYDSDGKLIDGKVETYYINGEIKTIHFYKKNTLEGERLDFNIGSEIEKVSEKELNKFLNE